MPKIRSPVASGAGKSCAVDLGDLARIEVYLAVRRPNLRAGRRMPMSEPAREGGAE